MLVFGLRKYLGAGLFAAPCPVTAGCHNSSVASKESQDITFTITECVTQPAAPVLKLPRLLCPNRRHKE